MRFLPKITALSYTRVVLHCPIDLTMAHLGLVGKDMDINGWREPSKRLFGMISNSITGRQVSDRWYIGWQGHVDQSPQKSARGPLLLTEISSTNIGIKALVNNDTLVENSGMKLVTHTLVWYLWIYAYVYPCMGLWPKRGIWILTSMVFYLK